MKYLVGLMFACQVLFLASVMAKPDRKDMKPQVKIVPNIAGPCIWGEIEQVGNKVAIRRHEFWRVDDGHIRADGKLFVMWIHLTDETQSGPGLYDIGDDGSIVGKWASDADAKHDQEPRPHGTWTLANHDIIRRAKEQP